MKMRGQHFTFPVLNFTILTTKVIVKQLVFRVINLSLILLSSVSLYWSICSVILDNVDVLYFEDGNEYRPVLKNKTANS